MRASGVSFISPDPLLFRHGPCVLFQTIVLRRKYPLGRRSRFDMHVDAVGAYHLEASMPASFVSCFVCTFVLFDLVCNKEIKVAFTESLPLMSIRSRYELEPLLVIQDK